MKRHKNILVDISGNRYLLKEKKVFVIEDFSEIKDFLFYIFIPDDSFKADVTRVSGPSKYAHLILNKRLEEGGNLTSRDKLWVYYKKKLSKTECELFYSIYSLSHFLKLSDFYKSYKFGTVIWDVVGFLMDIVSKKFRKEYGAIFFQVLNDLFVVIGKRDNLLFYSRYMISVLSDDELNNTISMAYGDILGFEQDRGIKVEKVLWIDGFTRQMSVDLSPFEDREVERLFTFNYTDEKGERWISALPLLVEETGFAYPVFGKEERWILPLEEKSSFLNIFLVCLIGLVLGTGFYLNILKQEKIKDSLSLNGEIAYYEKVLKNFSFPEIGVKASSMVSLFKIFDRAISSPSYADFWKTLSLLKPKDLFLNHLAINYNPEKIELDLRGKIFLTPLSAQRTYLNFLKALKREGFEVCSSNLDIDTDISNFKLILRCDYKK